MNPSHASSRYAIQHSQSSPLNARDWGKAKKRRQGMKATLLSLCLFFKQRRIHGNVHLGVLAEAVQMAVLNSSFVVGLWSHGRAMVEQRLAGISVEAEIRRHACHLLRLYSPLQILSPLPCMLGQP